MCFLVKRSAACEMLRTNNIMPDEIVPIAPQTTWNGFPSSYVSARHRHHTTAYCLQSISAGPAQTPSGTVLSAPVQPASQSGAVLRNAHALEGGTTRKGSENEAFFRTRAGP